MEPFRRVFCAVDLSFWAADEIRQASEMTQGPGAALLSLKNLEDTKRDKLGWKWRGPDLTVADFNELAERLLSVAE